MKRPPKGSGSQMRSRIDKKVSRSKCPKPRKEAKAITSEQVVDEIASLVGRCSKAVVDKITTPSQMVQLIHFDGLRSESKYLRYVLDGKAIRPNDGRRSLPLIDWIV